MAFWDGIKDELAVQHGEPLGVNLDIPANRDCHSMIAVIAADPTVGFPIPYFVC